LAIIYKSIIKSPWLLLLILLLNCDQEKATINQKAQSQVAEDIPDQEMWQSTVTSLNRGKKEAVVQYGHMLHYPNRKLYKFDEGVHVDFYDKTGAHASLLTAQKGELDEKTNNVKAMNHVVVVSDSGVTLNTEELGFDQNLNKIISKVDVKITTTKGDTFYGVGFESDTQLRDFEIKKLKGKAHKGFDLTMEKWKKEKAARSDSNAVYSVPADSDKVK
jgi:LPS export ABC transporter protein LptC